MSIRAPKGTAEATYIPKGSPNTIHTLFGIPTADWQDIQDAIDYNSQFGLWISASPGSSSEYPSYYGGSYITSKGLFPFYKVSDKDAPNYKITVPVADEDEYLHEGGESNSTVSFEQGVGITIGGIDSQILSVLSGLRFDFWGNSGSTVGAAVYELSFSGTKVQVEDASGNLIDVGTLEDGTQPGMGSRWRQGGTLIYS